MVCTGDPKLKLMIDMKNKDREDELKKSLEDTVDILDLQTQGSSSKEL